MKTKEQLRILVETETAYALWQMLISIKGETVTVSLDIISEADKHTEDDEEEEVD